MKILTFPGTGSVENDLIAALFEGDDPILVALRKQYAEASLIDRDLTGSGFFLKFAIGTDAMPVDPPDVTIDDVLFELEGLEHGGGAIAHVHNGYLDLVEAYLNAEDWPKTPRLVRVYYDTGTERDIGLLSKVWHKQ